jgi:glycosyltransferase involved in cell wall biosynthesis
MISVIIPVFNGESTLGSCLSCVFASEFKDFEVIVVDDHSSDNSRSVARLLPCRLVELSRNGGAAAARNAGAAIASGSILFFLDADILVQPDSLERVSTILDEHQELAAVFGSFQADTIAQNFFSQYKNLVHHHTHQTSRAQATTFASGFGAIRAEVFRQLGGFDPAQRFLEDIELGYRMNRSGYRVLLDKQLQTTHCKRYTFASLTRSDFFGRAIPWTLLMLEQRTFQNDLNTRTNNLLSIPVSAVILAAPLSLHFPWIGVAVFAMVGLLIALNYRFLRFLFDRKGLRFTLAAIAMTWYAYLYSGLGVLIGCATYASRQFFKYRALGVRHG